MLNSDLSSAAHQGGREPPTHNTRVVSMHRQVPANWVSAGLATHFSGVAYRKSPVAFMTLDLQLVLRFC